MQCYMYLFLNSTFWTNKNLEGISLVKQSLIVVLDVKVNVTCHKEKENL